MKNKTIRNIVIVSALYMVAQIFSDIASLRIVMLAGLSLDAGTLVYPFTFTLRDIVHKIAGASIARTLIILGAIVNVFMAGLFWLVSILPPDETVGLQSEFGLVLAPVFRIVLASIIAEVVSELIDTELYQIWVNRLAQKWQWGRVLFSNAVSVPMDSAIFCLIAFYGDLPNDVVMSIFIANVVIKFAVSILSIPTIYIVKDTQLLDTQETHDKMNIG